MRGTQYTEPSATRDLLQRLPAWLPGACDATKHADQFTSGIPDFTVAWNGYTSWVEAKMLKPGKSLDSELSDDQLLFCRRLEGATFRRCWILVWDLRRPGEWRTRIYAPSLVVRMRREGLPHPAETGPLPSDKQERYRIIARDLSLGSYLESEGVDHPLVRDVLLVTHRHKWHEALKPGS